MQINWTKIQSWELRTHLIVETSQVWSNWLSQGLDRVPIPLAAGSPSQLENNWLSHGPPRQGPQGLERIHIWLRKQQVGLGNQISQGPPHFWLIWGNFDRPARTRMVHQMQRMMVMMRRAIINIFLSCSDREKKMFWPHNSCTKTNLEFWYQVFVLFEGLICETSRTR